MAGPTGNHNWHDTFSGAEPVPTGPAKQTTNTPKNIVGGHAKPGPRSPSQPSPDTFSE